MTNRHVLGEALFSAQRAVVQRISRIHALHSVRNRVDASVQIEDVCQELEIAMWKSLRQFDPTRSSVRTYLERVGVSRARSAERSIRQRARAEGNLVRNVPREQRFSHETFTEPLCDPYPQLELAIDVRRKLERLSANDRRLAQLLCTYTPSEVAKLLGRARSTVYDGIARLRVAFAEMRRHQRCCTGKERLRGY